MLSVEAQELMEKDMHKFEMAAERVEGKYAEMREPGLTPEEAEELPTSDDEDDASATALGNIPPPVADSGLLHPGYSRGAIPLSMKQDFTFPRPKLSTLGPKSRLGRDVAGRLDELERYWEEQSRGVGDTLKRMLIVVDGLIVKEREEAQREQRRREMGWYDSEEEEEEEEEEGGRVETDEEEEEEGAAGRSCSVA